MLSNDDGQPQHQRTAAVPGAGQVRVLLVDDNQSFADLLSSALDTVDGITCVGTASSAVEGFQRVAELAPSVVAMDLMMPGLDGLAATRQLRELSPGTAVAVVSAHSQGEWIARAEDAGASAYIPKGGSLEEMIAMLSTARPGPMIVAPSLQPVWSSWERPAPEPAAPDQLSSRLRSRARRAKLEVESRIEAAERVRRPKLFGLRW